MLDRLLDELGYDRVDVLGFSWGGALAQQFAVQHAGRCRRVVVLSTNTRALSVPAAPSVFAEMVTPHGFRDNVMALMAGSVHGGIPGPAPTTSGDCSGTPGSPSGVSAGIISGLRDNGRPGCRPT
jgi:pimeloyl-ACP methyl ester carboxylesterase